MRNYGHFYESQYFRLKLRHLYLSHPPLIISASDRGPEHASPCGDRNMWWWWLCVGEEIRKPRAFRDLPILSKELDIIERRI